MTDSTEAEDPQYGCGYEYDHTIRELGEGHWECTECGADGWPGEADPSGGSDD